MSRIDDRISGELKGLARPVDLEGVAERVFRRKARRRLVRRVQTSALAVSVLAGTLAGAYGLLTAFGSREANRPGGGPGVGPTPTLGPTSAECDTTRLEADLTGDGVLDAVTVYRIGGPVSCDPPTEGEHYWARVETSTGTAEAVSLQPQELVECETPFLGCKAFGAPDIDGDGWAEVAIAIAPGGPATFYSLYRFDPEPSPDGPALIRLAVEPPGDPWHELYGFPPGPAVFAAYGSVTHLHWGTCLEEGGDRFLVAVTALRTEGDPDLYDVHSTVFRVDGESLEVVMSKQQKSNSDRLEFTDELCGAPLVVGA